MQQALYRGPASVAVPTHQLFGQARFIEPVTSRATQGAGKTLHRSFAQPRLAVGSKHKAEPRNTVARQEDPILTGIDPKLQPLMKEQGDLPT